MCIVLMYPVCVCVGGGESIICVSCVNMCGVCGGGEGVLYACIL